jgi:hypothetical protein
MKNNSILRALAVAAAMTLTACLFNTPTEGKFYRRLHRAMRDVAVGDTVVVRVADLFTRQWDTMYVFDPMSRHAGLDRYHDEPYYHDIGRRIVLVKDGKVVFREDEIAVEWPYSVHFPDGGVFSYNPQTAVFRAYFEEKGPNATRPHFVLLPEKEPTPEDWYDPLDTPHETYDLKGGYKLYKYEKSPEIYNGEHHVYRLVGSHIDTIVFESVSQEARHSGYGGIDFDDYFAISWFEFHYLFDKRTGKVVGNDEIIIEGYDTEHNLLLSDFNDGYDTKLRNLKTGKEVVIEDYFPPDADFTGQGVVIPNWKITVTGKWIHLLNDAPLKPVNVKIPAGAIGLTLPTVIAISDSVSMKRRPITREEYEVRKQATEHLRQPLTVVTDLDEVKRMLGRQVETIDPPEGSFIMKLTFNNGKTKFLDGDFSIEAYLPDLNILTFAVGHMGTENVNLDNGDWGNGWPQNGAVSPDKMWLVNGDYPGQGDGYEYLLRKWDQTKGKYEYVGSLSRDQQIPPVEWSWVGNDVVLIKDTGWDNDKEEYYEMTIIEKP